MSLAGRPEQQDCNMIATCGTLLAAIREAAAEFGIGGEPDLNAALRLPGLFWQRTRPGKSTRTSSRSAGGGC